MIKTYIYDQPDKKGCIVLLPGRLGSALNLMRLYGYAELTNTALVGMEPETEWYPIPNGVGDQENAICGMRKTRKSLLKNIAAMKEELGLETNQIALVGFSAGAVMAIQCAVRSDEPFAGIVAHSGAILQPRKTPPVKFPDMPFLLIHNRHDDCFKWHERYLPMKNVLRKRGYNVFCVEKEDHCIHGLTEDDVVVAASFLAERLGYADWHHSSEKKEHDYGIHN